MDKRDPTQVVLSQLDAYNRHDVDRFLSFYASDALITDRDGAVLDEGHEAMRKTFTELFIRMPEVRAEYRALIEVGEWVAVHDVVPNWQMRDGPEQAMQWLAVYRVVDNKIKELRLYC